jgi:hypothetical protein
MLTVKFGWFINRLSPCSRPTARATQPPSSGSDQAFASSALLTVAQHSAQSAPAATALGPTTADVPPAQRERQSPPNASNTDYELTRRDAREAPGQKTLRLRQSKVEWASVALVVDEVLRSLVKQA